MGRRIIDITGRMYGRLLVIGISHKTRKEWIWRVRCVCGTSKMVRGANLRAGRVVSCGCVNNKHGRYNTRVYRSYRSMLDRCTNTNHDSYIHYGARGIVVCKEWLGSFDNFYKDMGERPPGKSLDRIDTNGNYSPDNCKWSTDQEQSVNKRTTKRYDYNNQSLTIPEWSEVTGIHKSTIEKRIRLGWPIDQALTLPPQQKYNSNPKNKKYNHIDTERLIGV